jgi:trehalose utilization protein
MKHLLVLAAIFLTAAIHAAPIRVLVWDEQNKAQRPTYPNYIASQIASYLKTLPDLSVTSAGLGDTNFGLGDDLITNCDVLVYWSHVRNKVVPIERAREIAERVKEGKLQLIVLHSGLTSRGVIEAMNERTREDVAKTIPTGTKTEFIYPLAYKDPLRTDPITPRIVMTNAPDGSPLALVYYPICEITAWRETGEPVTIQTLLPDHPIAQGVPAQFQIPHTEVYSEPFHVPKPDDVIFQEVSTNGEIFRAGMVWKVGKGAVFYFSPGHETFPIYYQPAPLKIIGNAVEWLGAQQMQANNAVSEP